jgi:hypothetical protein
MFKIEEKDLLSNVITSLKKIDEDFDDLYTQINKEKEIENKDLTEIFNKPFNKRCPNCNSKMVQERGASFYSCEQDGTIVIIEDGQPISDIPLNRLPLSYSKNLPVNYYTVVAGITVKWDVGDWRALVVVEDPENEQKRFLRFYWWTRDMQDFMRPRASLTHGGSLSWEPRAGTKSPNISQKSLIQSLVQALEMTKEDLQW